jgi:UDP-GlcNAc:undecaprenyl-phosphate GlcNAc-1-phosphate transferase
MEDSLYYILLFSFFFFGMVAFSLLINSILLRFVKTLGTKNQPGAVVRWSSETKPAIGGLAFFILFLTSFWIYSIAFDANQVFQNISILGALVAATLAFLMGLTDDAYNTKPVLKFLIQVSCAFILLFTGTGVELFSNDFLNGTLTVLWVVAIMNSINMLDNMDGISSSVSGFVLLAAMGYMILHGSWMSVDFILVLGLLAALIGFLFFNWNPSSIYMGDTGSQFLGLMLAYIGIKYCFNAEVLSGGTHPILGFGALITVFLLPIADTTTVTINRLRKGQSPFVGGRDHTTHNLSYFGLSDGKVAGTFCILAAASTAIYLTLIAYFRANDYAVLAISGLIFVAVFGTLFGITEYNKKRNLAVDENEEKQDSAAYAKRA